MDVLVMLLIYMAVSLVISLGAQKAQTVQQKNREKRKYAYTRTKKDERSKWYDTRFF